MMQSLRLTRKEKGLSLKALGALIKIPHSGLSRIENGKNVPWYQTRQAIERILGKINWLDVPNINIEPIQSDWNDCERSFRALLPRIASLPEEQKQAFIKSIIKHLHKLNKEEKQ